MHGDCNTSSSGFQFMLMLEIFYFCYLLEKWLCLHQEKLTKGREHLLGHVERLFAYSIQLYPQITQGLKIYIHSVFV